MRKISRTNYKITVADLAPHVHSFLPNENKVEKIYNWLSNWIQISLECGKIHPYDLLPSKADLAYHIGVSQGSVQSVFKLLEESGLVESKQRLGTFIKGKKEKSSEKLTSKSDLALEVVKKFIIDSAYKKDDVMISIRKLSHLTGISNTTLRGAILILVQKGILRKENNNIIINHTNFDIEITELKTLAEKIADEIKDYILKTFVPGEKLPSNSELAKRFGVSIKTINDAMKKLNKEGLIYTKRGQYGTFVIDESNEVEDYCYVKYEQKLRNYIIKNCQVGDKLPTIKEFAHLYNTSERTIKKSLDNLADDGYIAFSRGRYGGTFVLDLPQTSKEAYKWLAINAEFR